MTNKQLLDKMKNDMRMRNFLHYTYDSYLGKTKDIMKYFGEKKLEDVTTEELESYGLEEIELPDTLTKIEICAFYYCEKLKEIKIPSNVDTIERLAFEGCSSLKEIRIPKSVTTVGDKILYECTNLETIYIENGTNMDNWSSTWLSGCNATVVYE